jgi:hypothetical protein
MRVAKMRRLDRVEQAIEAMPIRPALLDELYVDGGVNPPDSGGLG